MTKDDLFESPLHSSKIDIFVVKNLSEHTRHWKKIDIKCKLLFLEFENQQIAMSILHSY